MIGNFPLPFQEIPGVGKRRTLPGGIMSVGVRLTRRKILEGRRYLVSEANTRETMQESLEDLLGQDPYESALL
jgi:hypothetical protein